VENPLRPKSCHCKKVNGAASEAPSTSRAPFHHRSGTDNERVLVIYIYTYTFYSYVRSRNVLYSSRFLPLYYTRNWFIADRRRQRDAPVGVMVIIIKIIYFYFLPVRPKSRITRLREQRGGVRSTRRENNIVPTKTSKILSTLHRTYAAAVGIIYTYKKQ